MKTKLFTLVGAASTGLLAGCASQPVALSPIGPEPVQHTSTAGIGYLQVFSDTETHVIGDGLPYYPHTGYNIYDQSGARVQYVPNHVGNMDESPMLVRVPAGNLKIVAESSAYGRVTVPVVIEGGRTTVIHLDREWQPAANASSNELVRLPNGEAVGWATSSP
jgi:hypothetical protein